MTKRRPTPATQDPWSILADELAKLRARALELHKLAQTSAKYGDVSADTDLCRSVLSARHCDHFQTVGAALVGWEKTARLEAQRVAIRRSHTGKASA